MKLYLVRWRTVIPFSYNAPDGEPERTFDVGQEWSGMENVISDSPENALVQARSAISSRLSVPEADVFVEL